MTKLRRLTQQEIVAMWLYQSEYSKSELSAPDFYAHLSERKHDEVNRFVREVVAAKAETK